MTAFAGRAVFPQAWTDSNGTKRAGLSIAFYRRPTYTDGVTTQDSTTLGSASADFTSDDEGKVYVGQNFPTGTTIETYVDESTVEMSMPATASGTGRSFHIAGRQRSADLATVYVDRLKSQATSNPYVADAAGNTFPYLDPGDYDAVSVHGVTPFSVVPDHEDIETVVAGLPAEIAARIAADAALDAAKQPVDSDLTAIAALGTTAFGRGLLALADGAALAGSIPSGTYPATAALAATTGAALVGAAAYRRLTETTLPGQLQNLDRRARTTLDVMAGLTGTNAEQRQEVQARLDWCRDNARTAYFGEGLLTSMDAPLTIECGVDSDDGALLRPAAGVNGLILGTAANPLTERELILPRVRRLARAWTTSIGSDFGVRLQNVRNSRVLVREATDFSTGLEMGGLSTGFVGVAYNIIDLGLLGTNAVNIALRPMGDCWVNQNTFRGGRLTHHGIGVAMAGTRQVLLAQATYYPDNNTFVGVSMEGDNPEFHLECYGSANEWINCRWETVSTTPKAKWGATGDSNKPTSRNRIRGGFGSQNIVHTEDVGTGANTLPDYDTAERVRRQFSTSTGGLILQNFSSNDSPIISLLPASASPLSAAISTYGIQMTHSRLRAKASADVAARIDLNAALGRLAFGLGTAEPTTFLRGWIGGSIEVNGGALGFSADNTHDIGRTSSADRPRSIHLGTSVTVAGSQVVGARGAAVADATDATSVITQLNALLARLRSGTGHGLIAA